MASAAGHAAAVGLLLTHLSKEQREVSSYADCISYRHTGMRFAWTCDHRILLSSHVADFVHYVVLEAERVFVAFVTWRGIL